MVFRIKHASRYNVNSETSVFVLLDFAGRSRVDPGDDSAMFFRPSSIGNQAIDLHLPFPFSSNQKGYSPMGNPSR